MTRKVGATVIRETEELELNMAGQTLENGAKALAKAPAKGSLVITPPRFQTAEFHIIGTAPLVQLRFSTKAKNQIRNTQLLGSQAKKGRKKEARDFDQDYEGAMYISVEGWHGIPANSFRRAAIDACRLVGFKMTLAKLSLFVPVGLNDIDAEDGTPLIRLVGTPKHIESMVRNADGSADIRVRAMFHPWEATVPVMFDLDQFSLQDLANLMRRVGAQVGIGEGRPNSKNSAGMGWGTFSVGSDIHIRDSEE